MIFVVGTIDLHAFGGGRVGRVLHDLVLSAISINIAVCKCV